jgi:hypothetical protein
MWTVLSKVTYRNIEQNPTGLSANGRIIFIYLMDKAFRCGFSGIVLFGHQRSERREDFLD